MELTKELLLAKIEFFRKELLKVGIEHGYTNPETIRISENLDKLILTYQESTHTSSIR